MEEVKVKRFRIGNQTSYAAAKPIVPFEYAVINHFDAFEWFPDKKETGAGFDLKEIESKTRCHIREVARDHDISLSVHAPLKANPLTDDGQAVLMETFKFAHEIGAALLNIHLDSESSDDATYTILALTIDQKGSIPEGEYRFYIHNKTKLPDRCVCNLQDGTKGDYYLKNWEKFNKLQLFTARESADGMTVIRYDNLNAFDYITPQIFDNIHLHLP